MSRSIEIEKRYLVRELPDLSSSRFTDSIDVYFPEITDHAVLRARHQGRKYELTKKVRRGKGNKYEMVEQTINLSQSEFDFLAKCSRRSIAKTRYYIDYDKYVIELDVFKGKHKGLVIAEVEFVSLEEAEKFVPPSWFGEEINNIDVLAGGVLSGRAYKEIKSTISF